MSIENPYDASEKPKNVVELETENAIYYISYESHRQAIDTRIVKDSDAVIVEGIGKIDSESNALRTLNAAYYQTNNKGVIYESAANKKPVYFVDMSKYSEEELSALRDLFVKKGLLPAVELAAGAALVKSAVDKINDPEKLSRREFLWRGGKMLAGAYLSTPSAELISGVGSHISRKSKGETSLARKSFRAFENINDQIHPELKSIATEGRNVLIAQKSETIARLLQGKTKGKPKICIFIGNAHIGIEKALNADQSARIEQLTGYFGDKLERENKIAECTVSLDEDNSVICESIRIMEDPSLREKY